MVPSLVVKQYNGLDIALSTTGGVNATSMCKVNPKKSPNDWLNTKQARELIIALAIDLEKIPRYQDSGNGQNLDTVKLSDVNYYGLVKIIQGGNDRHVQGTWLHPDLAVPFAMWLDPPFALKVSRWIKELLTQGYVSLEKDAQQWQKFNELKLTKVLANPRYELDLARRLHSWMCLCGFTNISIEHPVLNELNKEKRRFDFYRNTSKTVEAYELKINPITTDDIINTISNKGYYEILQQLAGKNKIPKITFISPYNINHEVQRLIQTTKPRLNVITLSHLAQEYYIKGCKRKWKNQMYKLNELSKDNYYDCLFNILD